MISAFRQCSRILDYRKINVDDSDKEATEKAIQECVDDGCNIIFATSWGYMDATEEMAEKYPDIYFAHGTGYKSNGKNFEASA